jgi:hypothetical protein
MATESAMSARDPGPVLFVAREPDETLRTFLPVIDVLRRKFSLASTVLFHHQPGAWATDELRQRGVLIQTVTPPIARFPSRSQRDVLVARHSFERATKCCVSGAPGGWREPRSRSIDLVLW